jgi:hypothetical protein
MTSVTDSATQTPASQAGLASAASVLRSKARAWSARSPEEKVWVLPAFALLGLSRAALLAVPFRRIAPLLGDDLGPARLVPVVSEGQAARAVHIGRAVRTAAGYTPWESKCLAQAMAARVLLGASGIPYVLYLGVAREAGRLEAHAWVLAGRARVTGGDGFNRFTVVAAFVRRGCEVA